MSTPPKRRGIRLQVAGLAVGGITLAAFTTAGIWWMMSLRSPDRLAAFQELVASLGMGGGLLLLLIQYVQIVVAFIPGGPIQIVAGALYGPWIGLFICLLGTLLATLSVFALVQRFGHRIIALFVDEKDILNYSFLQDARKLELLIAALFFIPGTPKDALTYLFALTSIPMSRFMLISTCARIPAMLTSVLAGDSIVQGRWLQAAILFLIITGISICGLLLHRKITAYFRVKRRGKNLSKGN